MLRCFITWGHKSPSQWQHPGQDSERIFKIFLTLWLSRGVVSWVLAVPSSPTTSQRAILTFNRVWTANWIKWNCPLWIQFIKIQHMLRRSGRSPPARDIRQPSVCLFAAMFAQWLMMREFLCQIGMVSVGFLADEVIPTKMPPVGAASSPPPARDTGRRVYLTDSDTVSGTHPYLGVFLSHCVTLTLMMPRRNLEVSQSFVQNLSPLL